MEAPNGDAMLSEDAEPVGETGPIAETRSISEPPPPPPPPGPRRRVWPGSARPSSAAGWAAYPFAVFWRWLFPKKPRPFIVELPFLVVFALVLAFLIKTFLVQAFFIPSGSMQNTLAIGDRVTVNRAEVWLGAQPGRGDIVVFKDPGGWLAGEESTPSTNWFSSTLSFVGLLPQDDGDLIKRVIGVGGDHVVCCNANGQITVNRVPLNESSYLFPGNTGDSAPPGVDAHFDVIVPKGYIWVMGDHRDVSLDSRDHVPTGTEFVPVSDVVGKADLIVWPLSQWRALSVPGTFRQAGLTALSAPGAAPLAGLFLALPVTAMRRRRRLRTLSGSAARTRR